MHNQIGVKTWLRNRIQWVRPAALTSRISILTFAVGLATISSGSPSTSMAAENFTTRPDSLRLTYAVYDITLNLYFKENRNNYNPDFLATETYLRTFLREWSQALDDGHVRDTREYFDSVAKRNSFLGQNYSIWLGLHHGAIGRVAKSDLLNLGSNYRNTILASALQTERSQNFEQRSASVLESIQMYLLNNSAKGDQELGLSIADAYRYSPFASQREIAERIILDAPDWAKDVARLSALRWAVVGLVVRLPRAASELGNLGGLWSVVKKYASELWAKQKIIKSVSVSVPKVSLPKVSPIGAAGAASVAVHGAVALKTLRPSEPAPPSEAESRLHQEFASAPHGESLFTVALMTNLERIRGRANDLYKDFSATPLPRLDKAQWADQGLRYLSGSAQTFSFGKFFLTGERILGFWPKNEELGSMIFSDRLDTTVHGAAEITPGDVEKFRERIIMDDLSDYRGKRRTLTSVYLGWGGNCVSQTMLMVSAIQSNPSIIPAGYQLGTAVLPQHLEAVLVNDKEIWFLMSGSKIPRSDDITVLKPKALIVSALQKAGVAIPKFDHASLYITGRPTSESINLQLPLGPGNIPVSQAADRLDDTETGLVGLIGGLFKLRAPPGSLNPVNFPEWARQSFTSSSSSSLVSYVSSGFANMRSREKSKNDPPPRPFEIDRSIHFAGYNMKACLTTLDNDEPCGRRYHYYADNDQFRLGFAVIDDKLMTAEMVVAFKQKNDALRIASLPAEIWAWKAMRDYAETIASKALSDVSENLHQPIQLNADASRGRSMNLNNSDAFNLMAIQSASMSTLWRQIESFGNDVIISNPESIGPRPNLTAELCNMVRFRAFQSDTKKALLPLLNSSSPERKEELERTLATPSLDSLENTCRSVNWLVEEMGLKPEKFAKAFFAWPESARAAFLGYRLKLVQFSPQALLPLRNYLNSIKREKLKIKPMAEVEKSEKACLPMEIKLPKYSGPDTSNQVGSGPNVVRFRVYNQPPEVCAEPVAGPDQVDAKQQEKLRRQSALIDISADALAELSLIASGGVQLWNRSVLSALKTKMPIWTRYGFGVSVADRASEKDIEISFPLVNNIEVEKNPRLRQMYERANQLILESFYDSSKAGLFAY